MKTLIYAFPGLGKTHLVSNGPLPYVDTDDLDRPLKYMVAGHLKREAFILEILSRYVTRCDDLVVVTNFPNMLQLNFDAKFAFLPEDAVAAKRVAQRYGRDMDWMDDVALPNWIADASASIRLWGVGITIVPTGKFIGQSRKLTDHLAINYG
jgi:hypothetical protein